MLTNLKLALRGLVRNKVFTIVNLLGLSVSLVVCLLIFHFVRYEWSYDRFHKNAPSIYRVATKVTLSDEVITHEANTYLGISDALKTDYPEVTAATTVRQFTSDRSFVYYEDPNGKLSPIPSFKGIDTDSTFFKVFSFDLLSGNNASVLRSPYSVVVSESIAKNYFSGNAIGKFLELRDGFQVQRYNITGVCKDVPSNSHLRFDLITRSGSRKLNFWNDDMGFWDWTGQTYLILKDVDGRTELKNKLDRLAAKNNGLKRNSDDYGQISSFELQPLTDIHLFSHLQEELEVNGDGTLVNALVVLALIIMVVAWVNYINLSTAISENKTRSIGIKKVIGASRSALMNQVLTEAVLFNFISVFIALASVHLLMPAFSNFAGIPLNYDLFYDKWLLLFTSSAVVLGTYFSGLYPAVVVSSFNSLTALKGKMLVKGFSLRRVLVVFQFGTAVSLVVAAIVAHQQLAFMRNEDPGILIDEVAIIKALNFDKERWSNDEGGFAIDSAYLSRAELFKQDVRMHSGFTNVTALSHLPGQLPNWGSEFKAESLNSDNAYRLVAMGIDYDFLATLQVDLLAGRNFSPSFRSDRGNEGRRAILLNEAAVKRLGFGTPGQAVGKHISSYWGASYEIIGVVSSFHQLSLKDDLQPTYFLMQPRALEYFAVHYQGQNANAAILQLKSLWERHFPDYPFNFFFLDDYFDQQYRYDEKLSDMMTLFSGLAILIACLGLFGLTSYAVVQRSKEVAIRKVLGATISNVIGLFTHDFVKLIIIANLIALPIVYIGVRRWLDNYAYKITLTWWLFAVPVVFVLFIAVITIGLQTFKAASRDPVDGLRSE